MELQFKQQIDNILEDIELVLNHQLTLYNEDYNMSLYNYNSCVTIIINAFHTALFGDFDNYFDWYFTLMTQNIPKLDIQDFIELRKVTQSDFIRMYYWLIFDTFYVEENTYIFCHYH